MKSQILKPFILLTMLMCICYTCVSQHFYRVGYYNEGMAVVQKCEPNIGRINLYGYVNEYNKLVIPFKYTSAGDFKKGLAIVGIGAKYGIINKSGKEVIPVKYDDIRLEGSIYLDVDEKYYILYNNGKKGIVSSTGKILVPCKYDIVWMDLEEIYKGKRFWVTENDIFDLDGTRLLPQGYYLGTYNNIHHGKNGLCAIKKGNKYGVFSLISGKILLEAVWDEIAIQDGCIITVKDGLCGLMKDDGTELYPCIFKYADADIWGKGLYLVKENGEFGFFYKGQEVLSPNYTLLDKNQILHNSKNVEFSGAIERIIDGSEMIKCDGKYRFWHKYRKDTHLYDTILHLQLGVYLAQYEGKYGLIKSNGNLDSIVELLPFEYDSMVYVPGKNYSLGSSVVHCKKNDKWGVYTGIGESNQMSRLVSDEKMHIINAFLIAQEKGKFGFYLPEGNIIFKYEEVPIPIESWDGCFWLVKEKGKYGIVCLFNEETYQYDRKGNFYECIPPVYDSIYLDGYHVLTNKNGTFKYAHLLRYGKLLNQIELPYEEVKFNQAIMICTDENIKVSVKVLSVMRNGKWGYIGIDAKSNIYTITKTQFEEVGIYTDNGNGYKALVKKRGESYYINEEGRKIEERNRGFFW